MPDLEGPDLGELAALPTWEGFMVPVLEVMSDGVERDNRGLRAAVKNHARLVPAQTQQMLPSGQSRVDNRIGWAMSFLTRAGALNRPRRGRYVMTDSGGQLLRDHPAGLSENDLKQIPAFQAYIPASRAAAVNSAASVGGVTVGAQAESSTLDPIEQIESGVQRLNADVTGQLLERLRAQAPEFLEQAVLRVLVAMGYGGAEQRARRIGGTGDGGVDGVIDQDALGLEQIYVQAKRYAADNTVGREAIQAFVGALHGNQASAGVFITTSQFSAGAREYAARVPSRLVLIDGERLAALMINYQVGTQPVQTYTVVEVDEDFFE